MLTRFKLWLYYFFVERLLNDDVFISRLYNRIKGEEQFRDKVKDVARKAAREAQQIKDAERHTAEVKARQDSCSHAKGGRFSPPSLAKDFAVWDHTFTDNSRSVQCLICGKNWTGEQLNSPEVLHMLNNTTNTKSKSERVDPGRSAIKSTVNCAVPEETSAVFYERIDVDNMPAVKEDSRNFSEEEPYSPFMSLKHWNKLDKLYKKLTRKKKKNKLEKGNQWIS